MATTHTTILNDIQQWDSAGNPVRVAIAQGIAARLGPDFRYAGIQRHACGGQDHEIMSLEHLPTGMVFQVIPGGRFLLGLTPEEESVLAGRGWQGDLPEYPARQVAVRPFLMGRMPCSERAWRRHPGHAHQPLEAGEAMAQGLVSRLDATAWCQHFGFRLPTEAEWEYACRAGTRTMFYWGDTPDPKRCRMRSNPHDAEGGQGHADEDARANAFGLIDMLGTVSEWVEDDRHFYWEHEHNFGAYRGLGGGDGILRGGGARYGWKLNRCAARMGCLATHMAPDISFRPVVSIPQLHD